MTQQHTAATAGGNSGRPAGRLLDWRHAKASDPMEPCVLCGRPAILRDPDTNQPKHKVCAEAALAAQERA